MKPELASYLLLQGEQVLDLLSLTCLRAANAFQSGSTDLSLPSNLATQIKGKEK